MVRVHLGAPFNFACKMTFIIPFLSFFFSGFASIIITNKKVLSIIFSIVSGFAFLFFCAFILFQDLNVSYIFGNFNSEIGIEYKSGNINIFIATAIAFLTFIFSIFFLGFIKDYSKEFDFNILFAVIQIMVAAMLALSFTFDLFNFYVFFELTAICIYILLAVGGKGSTYASLNYLILGVIASCFIVLGIGFLYFSTGYLNIGKIAQIVSENNIDLQISFILISIGLLVKLAIFPFSFWPSIVYKNFNSALVPIYSATISLITLYAFYLFYWNIFYLLNTEFLEFFRSIVGILVFIGVVLFSGFAIFELDIRKILAYSTISQVSYAFFSLLLEDKMGVYASFLHLFNNGLSKIILFMIIFEITKDRKNYMISGLNMLSNQSKCLSFIILFIFAGILGLPLTFGFFTKLSMLLIAFKNLHYLFIFTVLLGAVLNFIYFWRIANIMFFKKTDEDGIEFTFSYYTKIAIGLAIVALILSTIFFNQLVTFLNASMQNNLTQNILL